jgi:hypothetical protein
MTKNEIRIRVEQIASADVPNIRDYHNLVERLCDLIEDVAEFNRDTAFEAGYDDGFADGQDEEADDGYDDGYDDGSDSRFVHFSLRI